MSVFNVHKILDILFSSQVSLVVKLCDFKVKTFGRLTSKEPMLIVASVYFGNKLS